MGFGSLFEVTATTHNLTVLNDFNQISAGQHPTGVVEDNSGNLFGTTYGGGADDDGTLYEVAAGSNTVSTPDNL